jgi:hypothetical protein
MFLLLLLNLFQEARVVRCVVWVEWVGVCRPSSERLKDSLAFEYICVRKYMSPRWNQQLKLSLLLFDAACSNRVQSTQTASVAPALQQKMRSEQNVQRPNILLPQDTSGPRLQSFIRSSALRVATNCDSTTLARPCIIQAHPDSAPASAYAYACVSWRAAAGEAPHHERGSQTLFSIFKTSSRVG